jgi:hypothetical protein
MLIGINILSIRSSVALAPYLAEAFLGFIIDRAVHSGVPRQAGKGLVIRSDGDLILRHEHHQESLGLEEVRHYAATTRMRSEVYDVLQMPDEVVLASVGPELLLSHPQSEIWLSREAVDSLVQTFGSGPDAVSGNIPDWLKVSIGGGRMLLSDQRTGRWVLLGADHLSELRKRLERLAIESINLQPQAPPVISLKGISVHLQSALKLLLAMEDFAMGRDITPIEELTPVYSLKLSRSANGLELSDSESHTVLNSREVRKWIDLVKAEIEPLHLRQIERGRIRTVFGSNNSGRWILQWGDEVFVPGNVDLQSVRHSADVPQTSGEVIASHSDDFLLVMNYSTGNCVALNELESHEVV